MIGYMEIKMKWFFETFFLLKKRKKGIIKNQLNQYSAIVVWMIRNKHTHTHKCYMLVSRINRIWRKKNDITTIHLIHHE